MDPILQRLNDPDPCNRLTSLAREVAAGPLPTPSGEVNNHIHTIYSFSPYSPAAAAWMAAQAGLKAAGIMDHDSLAGAEEMIEACKVLGIASTIGFELRVDCSLTRLNGRKINNPDSTSIAYVAIHGIPRSQIPAVARFLRPIQQARNRRNEAMTRALNKQLPRMGLPLLDFDRDVYQQSQAGTGGSITERHLLAALAQQMITSHGRGEALVTYLAKTLAIPLPQLIATALKDQANTHYLYDVLGVLKSTFLPSFFIQPGPDECIPVRQVIEFARTIGAIPAYAYLGDVTASPTGDKKAEHFEDEYLDLLFEEIVALGFRAVTYMPPRN